MTRSALIRRVGWMAAVLAVSVLAVSVDAKPQRNPRNQQRSAQRDDGPSRGRAQRQREAKPNQNRERQKADAQRRAQQDRNQQRQKAESQQRAQRERDQQRQRAQAQQRSQREREAQRQRADEAKRRQETQRARARRESTAHNKAVASSERGANWGVNAQAKKQAERQAQLRRQEQRLEQQRIEQRQDLRQAKQRFEVKVHREKRELRQRDQRLDARAHVLRHTASRPKVVKHVVTRDHDRHKSSFHYKPSYGHGVYRHGGYNSHAKHHDGHGKFGFRFSIGDYSSFYYAYGHKRYGCCTGGYYTWRWVPPLTVTRYDSYGDPYEYVIREGYYTRVWVTHYCRLGRHHYYPY